MKSLNGCENYRRGYIHSILLISKYSNILIVFLLDQITKNYLKRHTKGWGLYKQGKFEEALEMLQKSWDLRMKNAIYDHEAYLHLEAAKKVVVAQKNN